MSKTTATPSSYLRNTVYCALFTALIIIGGYISIPVPVGPVPIVLADFFVMLTGLFLGFKYGVISTILYMCLGAIGLPVFSGGKAGLAVIAGPTGGFIIGYVLLTLVVGLIVKKKVTVVTVVSALIAGNIVLYAVGIPWLKVVTHLGWKAAIAAGLTPFIAGMIIKIIAAAAIGRTLVPKFRERMAVNEISDDEMEDEI